jgi:hypothetical protein
MADQTNKQEVEVTIRLPAGLAKQLEEYCSFRRVTADQVVMRLVDRFLDSVLRREYFSGKF